MKKHSFRILSAATTVSISLDTYQSLRQRRVRYGGCVHILEKCPQLLMKKNAKLLGTRRGTQKVSIGRKAKH
jgi:hypothetical protein